MARLNFVWVPLFSTLTGCATAGSASYERLSASYERTEASRARGGGEDATRPAGGRELERAAFVRAVLERNPGVEAARQAFRAALARVRREGSFEDPMVDVGLAPLSIGSSRAHFGYEVGISQKLPWFGKRGLEAAAASAEAEAARSDFEAMRRELALLASSLYDQYTVTHHSLGINRGHAELVRVLGSSAAAQLESGRGSLQDPLQAETELAHLEHDSAVLTSEHEVIAAQMNELLHRSPEEPLAPPPKEFPLLPEPDVKDAKRLGSQAAEARPEIAAARHRAEAARLQGDRASREYAPDFTVSTSYNSMWDMPEHRWMVGLGFNLPVFAGQRATAGEEAAAMKAQFESEASRLVDSVRTQVFVSLKQLDESKHVLGLFETRLLPIARSQIDAARAGFIASRNPFMAVIEAERNLRRVELDYLMVQAEWNRRRGELDRALGLIPGLGPKGGSR